MIPEIINLSEKYFEDTVRMRRFIHENPETGFDVQKTASFVVNELKNYGWKIREGVGKTGVVCDLDVPYATRRVALRADMDALKIQELGEKTYKSKVPGKAHMCGHDCHTSILIGAGKVLSEMRDKLKVSVRLIFQPSEETKPGGAKGMIEDGVLEGVDEIFGLHVWTDFKVGTIATRKDALMAQPDFFEITIKGKGGHAAMPHLTPDPIVAGASMVMQFQTIVSRSVNPVDKAVLSIAQFTAGTTDNIIPEKAFMMGTVRIFDSQTKEVIFKRMNDIMEGIEKSYNVKCEMNYFDGYPVNKNDSKLTERFLKTAEKILGKENVLCPVPPFMGAEDFGYFSEIVPSCFFMLGSGNPEKGITCSIHEPYFDVDEECLKKGVQLMAGAVFSGDD